MQIDATHLGGNDRTAPNEYELFPGGQLTVTFSHCQIGAI
jgi:hypothetical protein